MTTELEQRRLDLGHTLRWAWQTLDAYTDDATGRDDIARRIRRSSRRRDGGIELADRPGRVRASRRGTLSAGPPPSVIQWPRSGPRCSRHRHRDCCAARVVVGEAFGADAPSTRPWHRSSNRLLVLSTCAPASRCKLQQCSVRNPWNPSRNFGCRR